MTTISDFRAKIDARMRPNRFTVVGPFPSGPAIETLFVKAASFPGTVLGIIPLPFQGRIAKLPGDRLYNEWTFGVYMTGEPDFYKQFTDWHNQINNHATNVLSAVNDAAVFKNWNVNLLDIDGSIKKTIQMHTCWPVAISDISLSYDASNTISEYSITMAYDFLTHVK